MKDKIEIIVEQSKKEDVKFPCPDCDFKANSRQGLKVLNKRKHNKYTKESQPKKCEICGEVFKDLLGTFCLKMYFLQNKIKWQNYGNVPNIK